jgi:hypothetical protein
MICLINGCVFENPMKSLRAVFGDAAGSDVFET